MKILEVPGNFFSKMTKYLDSYEVYQTISALFLIPKKYLLKCSSDSKEFTYFSTVIIIVVGS